MRKREIAKITQGFELNTQADGGTFHRNREDWYRETRGPKTTTSVLDLLGEMPWKSQGEGLAGIRVHRSGVQV